MNENGGDFGAFMAGFVIGGLVGAATALLMAPQSGAETRAEIVARGEQVRKAGTEQVQHYSELAGTTIKETTEQLQERARIVLDEGKSKISPTKEGKLETVEETAQDESDAITSDEEGIQEADA